MRKRGKLIIKDLSVIQKVLRCIQWGKTKFQELAKDAKACYKVNQLVLVNLDILDAYLETFRITDEDFYK